MIALLQRVISASVTIDHKLVAEIDRGLLAFIAIEKNDEDSHGQRLLQRILSYRIFPDQQDKMNLGLQDIQGELLIVPQFTLAADTRSGCRPSFSAAAPADISRQRFEALCTLAATSYPQVKKGVFAADMQVSLINDGPVTFWLQV